jgi:hypothetical protein
VCAYLFAFLADHGLVSVDGDRWGGGEREGRTDGTREGGASPTVAHLHWFDGDDRSIATSVTRHWTDLKGESRRAKEQASERARILWYIGKILIFVYQTTHELEHLRRSKPTLSKAFSLHRRHHLR